MTSFVSAHTSPPLPTRSIRMASPHSPPSSLGPISPPPSSGHSQHIHLSDKKPPLTPPSSLPPSPPPTGKRNPLRPGRHPAARERRHRPRLRGPVLPQHPPHPARLAPRPAARLVHHRAPGPRRPPAPLPGRLRHGEQAAAAGVSLNWIWGEGRGGGDRCPGERCRRRGGGGGWRVEVGGCRSDVVGWRERAPRMGGKFSSVWWGRVKKETIN